MYILEERAWKSFDKIITVKILKINLDNLNYFIFF